MSLVLVQTENKYSHIIVQTDYLGNIYFKYDDEYYIVNLVYDTKTGIELTKIQNVNIFKDNLHKSLFVKANVKTGVLNMSTNTLRGVVQNDVSKTDEENNIVNTQCIEDTYYWSKHAEEYDDEDEINNDFCFNNVGGTGIVYSDLLANYEGSFNTIFINGNITSKNVISTIERIDGYSHSKLIIYTSGHLKVYFFDKTFVSSLIYNNDVLDTIKCE